MIFCFFCFFFIAAEWELIGLMVVVVGCFVKCTNEEATDAFLSWVLLEGLQHLFGVLLAFILLGLWIAPAIGFLVSCTPAKAALGVLVRIDGLITALALAFAFDLLDQRRH